MKGILFFIGLLISLTSIAQFPAGTDTLRKFNTRFIDNDAKKAFTNLRLHNLLAGIIDNMDSIATGGGISLGMDTLWAQNDTTLIYRKNGLFYTVTVRGANTGAGPIYRVPFSDGTRLTNDSNFKFDKSQGADASRLIAGPTTITSGGLAKINATSDNMNALALTSYGTGLNTIINRRARGTIGAPAKLLNDDDLFSISGRGHDGVGFSSTSRAAIFARTSQNWGVDSNGTNIQFATTSNDSNALRTRLKIDHNGDVYLSNYPNKTRSTDTLSVKPLGIDTLTGLIKPIKNWTGGGSFGGINIGAGYRWLATPAGSFKTSFAGYGVLKDSTSNTNGITDKVDTATLKSVYLPLTLNSAKTVNQAGNNIYFTGGGKPVSDSILYTPAYVNPVIGLDTFVVSGTSIEVGSAATVIPDSSWAGRAASYINLRLVNIAISGGVAFQICKTNLAYIDTGHNAMQSFSAGLNDFRAEPATNKVYRAVGNSYEAALINHCMTYYKAAQDCSLYGSWTNFDTKANAGGKTTRGAYSSTLNDSIVVNVTGTNVYIGMVGIHAAAKLANVYIDGLLMDVVDPSDNGYTNSGSGYQSMGKYYTGLSNTSHHVKIIVGTGSNFLLIDYIGSSGPNTKPFVFMHIPYLAASEYPNGNATQAIIDHANDTLTARYNRAKLAGLNVYLGQVNSYYTTAGISGDGIHPNDLGHYQHFSSFRTAITSTTATNGVLAFSNDLNFYGGSNGFYRQLAYTDKITLQRAMSTSSYLPASNYISGPGNLEFNGFNQIKLNKLRISNSITATFDGILQIRSANGGFYILNRDLDTTKGFGFYCSGNILRITDGYNNTDIIKFDTSFRTVFRNNKLGGLTTASATVHIEGNVTGAAGRASLKIGSGVLMSTPEDGAIEYNGTHYYATIGSTRRQIDQQAAITSVNSMTGQAITISGGTGITTSSASNDVTISIDNASAAVMHTIAKSYTPVDNTSTTETDLYSHTIPVVMTSNGTGITYDVSGGFNDATSTPRIKLYFAGNTIFDSGVLAISVLGKWNAHVEITRVTSSTAVSTVTFSASDLSANYEDITDLTSLDFTTTNILKITGTATGATGGSSDITAKQGRVTFVPAP